MSGYDPTVLTLPTNNEIEFSLFGPGFGECAVCHLGNGEWLIVDSCLDPNSRTPVALRYLTQLGVTPESAVVSVVATHWHDDHIQGLGDVLAACTSARFSITSAFSKEDFQAALAVWMDGGSNLDAKGLGELRKLIKVQRKPFLAGESKVVFERHTTPHCQVMALSPSDASTLACIAELMKIPKTQFTTRMPTLDGNHASVVLSVAVEGRRLLLGGDLQVRADRKFGWLAVVDTHIGFERPKHHVYKVPHHGSLNGDNPEIWEHLLEADPHAVLAPFVGGRTKLPTDDDCARIKRFSSKASITALPASGKFRHPVRQVEKTMQEATRSLEVIPHRFGHVRLRGLLDTAPQDWRVEYFGDAQTL